MHVLLICRAFPHHRAGGMEWHVQDVAEGLMTAGRQVSVLTTPLPEPAALKPLQVNGEILIAGDRPGRYTRRFFQDFWFRRKQISALTPDIVHSQGFAGVAAHWILPPSQPQVTTVHGTLWSETPLRMEDSARLTGIERLRLLWRFKHRAAFAPLWKNFVRSGAELIFDSEFSRQELARETGTKPRGAVVPLGFALERLPLQDRAAARQAWDCEPDELLLVSIGRMEEIKAPDFTLRAFLKAAEKTKRPMRLIMAGEGPMRAKGEQIAKSSNIDHPIHFPGRIAPEQIASLLAAADLFINPDQGAPAFGLANAEALCQGTPVLTTDRGAHREVVSREEFGWLTPAFSAKALTKSLFNALSQLPESPSDRMKRRETARARFLRDRMISDLQDVYRAVIQ